MRKFVVVGAAAILSLGVGGTALAASNGLDDQSSGINVRPVSTTSPSQDASHDVGDDHGGTRAPGVSDDGIDHDLNDDHGGIDNRHGGHDDGSGHH